MATFVSHSGREKALGRLGVTGPARALALGLATDPIFWFRAEPPFYSAPGTGAPDGEDVVALWECQTRVTGARRGSDGRLEFLKFDLESPDDFHVIGSSEQSVLADLFLDLYEDEHPESDLRRAAAAVGFRYLDGILRFHVDHPADLTVSHDEHRSGFTRGLTD